MAKSSSDGSIKFSVPHSFAFFAKGWEPRRPDASARNREPGNRLDWQIAQNDSLREREPARSFPSTSLDSRAQP